MTTVSKGQRKMAPRKQPKTPPQAQDACKLTAEDEIHVTSRGFLVNGTLRPNLDNCELGAGVTFIAQYDELVEDGAKKTAKTAKRAPSKPISAPKRAEDAVKVLGWAKDEENEASSASEQFIHAPKQHIQLPAELAELQELIDVYEDAQGAGPYVAIAVVGAYLWRKFQRQKQEQGQRCECATCQAHRGYQYASQHQVQHQVQQHQVQQHQVQHHAPQEQRCLCPECVPPAPVAPSAPAVSAPVAHAVHSDPVTPTKEG
jgi:hypothetical protein